jgi:hypothetical protein
MGAVLPRMTSRPNPDSRMRCYVASKFGDDLVLFKVEVHELLKDFFFCNTWRELFVAAVVGAMGSSCSGLLVFVFVLFG